MWGKKKCFTTHFYSQLSGISTLPPMIVCQVCRKKTRKHLIWNISAFPDNFHSHTNYNWQHYLTKIRFFSMYNLKWLVNHSITKIKTQYTKSHQSNQCTLSIIYHNRNQHREKVDPKLTCLTFKQKDKSSRRRMQTISQELIF